jgi:uncharacterized DUF497 family protein
MIKIKQLAWDDWNVRHIKKHKVTTSEVEEVCKTAKKALRTYRERLLVLGTTKKKRFLTVILISKGKGKYYDITARDMSKKERKLFQNDQD